MPYFRFLAEQTRGLLEAYYAAVGAALGLEGEVAVKELRKAVAQQFERDQLLGEVDHPEAANPVTFANALDLLVRHDILATVPLSANNARSRDPAYTRGPAYDDLPALRERLATALSAR